MPEFEYKARDPEGKIVTDIITDSNSEEAAHNLQSQHLQVITLRAKSSASTNLRQFRGKVSVIEKANFCRYLSTMINAGLPLTEAINAIARDTKKGTLKHILIDIEYRLQQGESIADTLSRYPHVFDPIFITIVRAGERSGTLQKSFQYLEDQLISSHNLSQNVKGALIYPAVIVSTMFGVGVILIVFVVPQIAKVFLSSKLPIPRLTTMILEIGLAINQHLILVGGVILALIITTFGIIQTNKGKQMLMHILAQLPIVNKLFSQLDLARFSRTLSTLMQTGVPITEALSVATMTFSQPKFLPLGVALQAEIKKGESISSILRNHDKVIPEMMISMVSTGEKTGTTDKILHELALFYEKELGNEIKNFTAILEPVIMLLIGICVGGMVLSIIAPIYSLVSTLQSVN